MCMRRASAHAALRCGGGPPANQLTSQATACVELPLAFCAMLPLLGRDDQDDRGGAGC